MVEVLLRCRAVLAIDLDCPQAPLVTANYAKVVGVQYVAFIKELDDFLGEFQGAPGERPWFVSLNVVALQRTSGDVKLSRLICTHNTLVYLRRHQIKVERGGESKRILVVQRDGAGV